MISSPYSRVPSWLWLPVCLNTGLRLLDLSAEWCRPADEEFSASSSHTGLGRVPQNSLKASVMPARRVCVGLAKCLKNQSRQGSPGPVCPGSGPRLTLMGRISSGPGGSLVLAQVASIVSVRSGGGGWRQSSCQPVWSGVIGAVWANHPVKDLAMVGEVLLGPIYWNPMIICSRFAKGSLVGSHRVIGSSPLTRANHPACQLPTGMERRDRGSLGQPSRKRLSYGRGSVAQANILELDDNLLDVCKKEVVRGSAAQRRCRWVNLVT
ncbi:hypothetical protein TIFTF001_016972 [Ficus carica]|uniref:Uncharacterized protein n=1 Tax=Ficus carica TaxID=3494 RepID=A0AA88A436_FICCA|nr:hypothetical protein TIFTF001_016972 [Ficus carica]